LLAAFPNDPKISQALKNVNAQRTLSEGGYETIAGGEGSYRDILKDKAEAISLEQEKREVKAEDVIDKLIAAHQARIPHEPHNLTLLRSIAELCVKKNDFDRALEYYEQLLAKEGANDPTVEKAIADSGFQLWRKKAAAKRS
jgi:tetratricopeptide (TPR) repeat protein